MKYLCLFSFLTSGVRGRTDQHERFLIIFPLFVLVVRRKKDEPTIERFCFVSYPAVTNQTKLRNFAFSSHERETRFDEWNFGAVYIVPQDERSILTFLRYVKCVFVRLVRKTKKNRQRKRAHMCVFLMFVLFFSRKCQKQIVCEPHTDESENERYCLVRFVCVQ